MRLLTIFTAALLCAKMIPAEEKEKAEVVPIPVNKQVTRSAKARDATGTNLPSLSVTDTWTNITIQPGTNFRLDGSGDYTGAERVSVSIECPTATSLQNVSILVWWSIPSASFLTLTDVIRGSAFLVKNMGGAVTSSYGNQLMMQVANTGTVAITCDQVTTYAVVH